MSYNDELLEIDDTSLYSYSEAATGWVNRGGIVSAQITQHGVANGASNQYGSSNAVHSSGLQCFVWYDATALLFYYSIYDINTGATVLSPTQVVSPVTNVSHVEVQCIGSYFVIIYEDNGVLAYKYISVTTPTTLSGATNIDGAMSTDFVTSVVNNQLYVAWEDTGPAIKLTYYTTTTLLTGVPTTTATVESKAVTSITVFGEATTNNIIVAYWNSTDSTLRFRVYTSALVAVTSAATISTPIYTAISITGCSAVSSSFTLFYTGVGTGTDKTYVVISVTVTNNGAGTYTAGAPARFKQGCFLTTRAFSSGSTLYVGVMQIDDVVLTEVGPGTHFLLDSSANVVARFFDETGAGALVAPAANPQANLSSVYSYDSAFRFTADITDLLFLQNGGSVVTQTGVVGISLNLYDEDLSYAHAEAANALHLGGGFLWEYDGQNLVEHGFHVYPQRLVSNSGGGTTHTYYYVACYEWTDVHGNLHRSEPSAVLTYQQTNAIDGSHAASVKVPYLSFTRKTSSLNPVLLVLYRTQENGTLFYKVSSLLSPTVNSISLDYATIGDTVTDANLVANVPLYTTGGVLDNNPAPPFSAMTVYNSRVFGINSLNPNEIWYSKQCTSGVPVEWSDFLTLTLPEDVGGTALAAMDGKLVIFSESRIFVLAGLGPDSTGNNNDFGLPQEVSTAVGCSWPRSIVRTPDGLMFWSAKGFYLLDRSLQAQYIGSDLATPPATAPGPVSATLMPLTTGVLFGYSNDEARFYDYNARQWGLDETTSVDAVIHDNLYHSLSSDGTVSVETLGDARDNGAGFELYVETGWIQLAGIQGFQRIYEVLLLGQYLSPHELTVAVSYDFVEDEFTTTRQITSDPEPYQFRFFIERQKCQAIRIRIYNTTLEPIGNGGGLSVSSLAFKVGVKRGPFKLPATKSSTPNTGS